MAKCKCCGAPCTRHVEPRGGDGQGWGTTDEERAYYRYDDSRNRELTRQVEQMAAEAAVLQARVDAAEKDAARYRYLRRDLSDPDLDRTHCSLEVHQQVNEGDDKPWRCWRTYGQALDVQVDLAIADLAVTAPPSSSDPGRNDSKGIEGDTGREET